MGGKRAQEGREFGGRVKVPERVEENDVRVEVFLVGRWRGQVDLRISLDPGDARAEGGCREVGLRFPERGRGAVV